jgi:hypothetical protein
MTQSPRRTIVINVTLDRDDLLSMKPLPSININLNEDKLRSRNSSSSSVVSSPIEDIDDPRIQKELTKVLEKTLPIPNPPDTAVLYNSISGATAELMKRVEKYHIQGLEKKSYVISTIDAYLQSHGVDGPVIACLVQKFLPNLIDTLIAIDRRDVQLK